MARCMLTLALTAFAFATMQAADADKKATKPGADFEAMFKKIDANNDGKITKEEFAKLPDEIKAKGEKGERIAQMITKKSDELFTKLDADKSGDLSMEEAKKFDLAALVGGNKAVSKDPEAEFAKLDKDNDKKLSKDEFQKALDEIIAVNPDKADRIKQKTESMFSDLDGNKDGSLTIDEFKTFNMKKAKKPK